MSSAVIGCAPPIAIPIGIRIAERSRIDAESVMFIGRVESECGGIEDIDGIESFIRMPAESCFIGAADAGIGMDMELSWAGIGIDMEPPWTGIAPAGIRIDESCAAGEDIFILPIGRLRVVVDFVLAGFVDFFFFGAGFLLLTLSFIPLIPGIDWVD